MKISYIMIVLNGMPFIQASLKSIYESAYEIFIIEGNEEKAAFAATSDGFSTDGTTKFIKLFPDPDKKIKIINQSPLKKYQRRGPPLRQGVINGKKYGWIDKCAMQNQAVKKATGDYIWLVDSDEVYKEEDINVIIQMLDKDPSIYQIDVPCIHFWKGYNWILDSKISVRQKASRIFKNQQPCYFSTHRPPTMYYCNLRRKSIHLKIIDADILKSQGVCFYHYSYVLNKQVWQKANLYKEYGWEKPWNMDLKDWYENCFMKWTAENREEIEKKYTIIPCAPKSKTKLFTGTHPIVMKDIIKGTK